MKKEIIKLLDAGIIYAIEDSPWVSSVHCVPKKGGMTIVTNEKNELVPTRTVIDWRVCIDYRKLNEATRKDHFPLLFMDQMLERLAGNKFFCFLDGFFGYFQIPIEPVDQEKTTFTYPYGTYAYKLMPFGLCNAPANFQRCMIAIFQNMLETSMEVFMDDFLKCHFMVTKGIMLGYKVSSAGLEVEKIDVITKLPPPTNVKAIRSFLGHAALVDLGASVSVMSFSTYTNLGLGILSHTKLTIELADRTIKQPRGIAENVLVRIAKFIFLIDFIILDIPEDDDVHLILGRPFLSTTHSKIDVFKRKITIRVGDEKLVFKSVKPAISIIKRVFMLKNLDSRTEHIGEGNESFDPLYGNYIELNDLDTPLMNQDVDFELTFVKTNSRCYKMKFSCVIRYKHVNAEFLPSLSINLMTKSFYYSIIKDKNDYEGKRLVGALIDIPIFVGNFSIISGFTIIDDDDVIRDVVLGMPFCKKYVSCQMIMKKFAYRDDCERIKEE
ncbi:reverse transcriptase domain-containing protein [Tanacetum coccineum]